MTRLCALGSAPSEPGCGPSTVLLAACERRYAATLGRIERTHADFAIPLTLCACQQKATNPWQLQTKKKRMRARSQRMKELRSVGRTVMPSHSLGFRASVAERCPATRRAWRRIAGTPRAIRPARATDDSAPDLIGGRPGINVSVRPCGPEAGACNETPPGRNSEVSRCPMRTRDPARRPGSKRRTARPGTGRHERFCGRARG